MKKLFLIPLMTLVCSVMAMAKTYQVGDYADLKDALEAGDATLIELTADITYPGTWATFTGKQPAPNQKKDEVLSTLNPTLTELENALTIKNSLTLDGKGFQLIGFGKQNVNADASTNNHRATLVIRPDNANDAIQVTIKNLSLGNTVKNLRYYGIIAFDGVSKVIYDNINVVSNNYSNQQALCFTGTNATPIDVTIKDSYLNSGNTAYSVYVLKPIVANISNTTIEGWCAIYFKYRATAVYGNVVGSRGSEVTCDACQFICPNVHNGESNSFALFPIEDDGITMNFNNCSFNAEQIGDQQQSVFSMQYRLRDSDYQPIELNITGDNTHMYNISMVSLLDKDGDPFGAVFEEYLWWKRSGHPDMTLAEAPLSLNIEGGTFSIDPNTISFPDENGDRVYAHIPSTHEVQVVKQGDANLFRVVKKAQEKEPGVMYDLNDLVVGEGEAEGNNPVSSFDLSTGEPMTLNNEITTAGYVSVSDDPVEGATTVTVAQTAGGKDQTLVINNGLDVQGESQVIVESGAALVIGQGGITTEDPENIIIEANENGAASLLLEPSITVNQNPELTVKMTVPAEHAGYEMQGSDKYRHWFRFAVPVKDATTWTKTPNVPTFLYGWDYAGQQWAQVSVAEMDPFYGYTLSPDQAIDGTTAVTYIFKGKLLGNEDCKLELNHHGYNFFGNSYTGYISILKLVDQILGDGKIDGTVWMWDGEKYEGVALATLREYGSIPGFIEDWKKEVAPMQTFVLRLTGAEFSSTDINYADAIWGNPRYTSAVSIAAPARQVEINDNAVIRMTVSANNHEQSVTFIENNEFSDEYNRGYDAIKYMNENSINMYVNVNGENYGTVATDNLEGKTLSLRTNDAYAYNLTFDFVAGEEYAIRDNATGAVIAIEQGASYEFAAQPNSTIEGRFEIVPLAKIPTAIENTEVKANVKGIYTIMGQYLGEDFEVLPAGVYVVNGVKIVK